MAYLLYHYFDPAFDHRNLKPGVGENGKVDRYNLGYAQNVVKGQVVAEFIPLSDEQALETDSRYVYEEPVLPIGPNCCIAPDSKLRMLADANGYVFYHDGLITVKRTLNVRGDVDFHTGNIYFVSDLAVHGDIRAGFEVQANNILIKGVVEGATVRSSGAIAIGGGARGASGNGLISAGTTLQCTYADSIELRAHDNILINKFCFYCTVYAGSNFVVRGRHQGGTIHCNGLVYVESQLGNAKGTPTRVLMGYDPFRVHKLERFEERIKNLKERIQHYDAVAGNPKADGNEMAQKLAAARRKMKMLLRQREGLWRDLASDEAQASRCRVVVPGTVHPGVEISIGKAYFAVTREMRNVCFVLEDDAITTTSPAVVPKKA